MEGFNINLLSRYALIKLLLKVTDRLIRNYNLRETDDKGRAFVIYALYFYVTAHHLKQVFGDRKSKSCAFHSTVLFKVYSFKFGKEFTYIFLFDAYAGIRNRHDKAYGTFFV